MDVTHFGGWHYLTLIDCGPSQFAIWRLLLCQDSASIIRQLENVFIKKGVPVELLTNNGTVFCEEMFTKFTEVCGIWIRF